MKKIFVLFSAFSLACVPVVAHSQSRAIQTLDEMPARSSGGNTPEEASSSGASSNAGAAGGEGQLITESIVKSKGGEGRPDIPQQQTANGINYLCGGVGSEETRYMKSAARDYDLMMTFAASSGNYVANVKVAIEDARGNRILQATCDGPILLVDLPKGGTYRVHADASGHVLNRTVQVSGKGRTRSLAFSWPSDVVGVESNRDFSGLSRNETSAGASGSASGASGVERRQEQSMPAGE